MGLGQFIEQTEKGPTIAQLQAQLEAVKQRNPAVLERLGSVNDGAFSGLSEEQKVAYLANQIEASIDFVKHEPHVAGEEYHTRDPLGGKIQSLLSDDLIPALQATGEGNPVVWIPSAIDGLLERVRPKYPFQKATAKSRIQIPSQCKVALLSDWGAANLHAQRIGDLAIAQGADYVIHLGDIYYSGTQAECETFVSRWPLKGADGKPWVGRSFALNGNHEMYSMGKYYFTTVLGAFQQEASYFTLFNDEWQLQGIDTAYEEFTIDGGGKDDRLQAQWDWLMESVFGHPEKKNIFLSHNQPVSAHMPEYEAAHTLLQQYWKFIEDKDYSRVFAWFFGHEHRCMIYDDTKTEFKARLIGNGSIPHPPQTEMETAVAANGATATPVWRVNRGSLEGGVTALSSFAMLTFDGEQCGVEYFNEDGTTFYREMLSGGPNSELDAR